MTALLTLVVFFILVIAGFALFTSWTAQRVDAALPPPGKFIDIDGSRIHYVESGSGQPILMIPGLGAQLRHLTYSMVDMNSGPTSDYVHRSNAWQRQQATFRELPTSSASPATVTLPQRCERPSEEPLPL